MRLFGEAVFKPTPDDIRKAEAILLERQLTVDAMNAAGATDSQIMPALRARDSVKGWLAVAEQRGEVRLKLSEI